MTGTLPQRHGDPAGPVPPVPMHPRGDRADGTRAIRLDGGPDAHARFAHGTGARTDVADRGGSADAGRADG